MLLLAPGDRGAPHFPLEFLPSSWLSPLGPFPLFFTQTLGIFSGLVSLAAPPSHGLANTPSVPWGWGSRESAFHLHSFLVIWQNSISTSLRPALFILQVYFGFFFNLKEN